jgi:hypothetical protein
LALFLGIVLSQMSWFFRIVYGHYVFSSIVVSWHCLWALCFFKHRGFLALFMGIVFFQALWFLNIVYGHYGFSSVVVS